MLGLYDSDGVLRFAGRDRDDCLAYAELFALEPSSYSLESLTVLASVAALDNVHEPVKGVDGQAGHSIAA